MFDFDAHIERRIQQVKMEKKRGQGVLLTDHDAWVQWVSDFKSVKLYRKYQDDAEDAIDFQDDDDDYIDDFEKNVDDYDLCSEMGANPGVVPKLDLAEGKTPFENFEQIHLGYDLDDVGVLDEDIDDLASVEDTSGSDSSCSDFMEATRKFRGACMATWLGHDKGYIKR